MSVVPFRRPGPPSTPTPRASVPVLIAYRPAVSDLDTPPPEETGRGSDPLWTAAFVVSGLLGAFGLGLGLIIKAVWP